MTEDVAISGVEGELDLGGFALTGTVSVADSTLTITNGTLSWASATFTVEADAEVTLAEDATLTGNGSNEPVIVNGTLNVYGTIDDLRGDGFGVKINPGATVNCYEGCSIASGNSAFKPYPNTMGVDCYLNIYGGTFTAKSPTSGATYGVIYCTKTASNVYIKIADGTFQALTAKGDSIFRNCAAAVFQDADGEAGLDDTCTATFNVDPLAGMNATTAASFFKTGYKAVQSTEDNLWRITKVYGITINPVENGTLETSVTNGIVAGTTVNVYATPATGYECTQITTNGAAITGTSFDMPADGVQIGATFTLQQFTVAAISVDNASVVATNTVMDTGLVLPATVDYNTAIVVTVTPNSGYEYKTTPAGWTKNGNGSITTNATVTAALAITVEAPTAADPWNPPADDTEASQKVEDLGFSTTAVANINTVAEFTKFETYVKTASGKTDPAQLTANQKANAYLAYALNATAIPDVAIESDDVEITSFDGGVIEITIEGIEVGSDVPPAMIAKVIDVVGNDELTEMSAANVTTTGRAGVNGKVQVTVTPAVGFAESTKFFYRASVKK